MKRIGGESYLEGIHSLEIFSEMLGQVLKEALPGVQLKRVSAYDWRGFQIVKYPGLKERQFFCQIYLSNPQLLIFQEYFEMVRNIKILAKSLPIYCADHATTQASLNRSQHDVLTGNTVVTTK